MTLEPVLSSEHALMAVSFARQPGTRLHTNLFANRSRLDDWVAEDSLFLLAVDGASALLRRDRDFFHVYLTFVDDLSAGALLAQLPDDETLVTDVVGDGVRDRPITEVFEAAGYRTHRLLHRLKRRPAELDTPTAGRLRTAVPTDTEWILEMLERHFDRFSEQLPTELELRRAIEAHQITVAAIDGACAGFLFDESVATRSTLRYWFVAPERREARVGAELLRNHLATQCVTRTSELWVVDDNENAIKRYLHYGYERDALSTRVLMRGPRTDGS